MQENLNEGLEKRLKEVRKTPSNRMATRLTGWLNSLYGNSRENRRTIQLNRSARKRLGPQVTENDLPDVVDELEDSGFEYGVYKDTGWKPEDRNLI